MIAEGTGNVDNPGGQVAEVESSKRKAREDRDGEAVAKKVKSVQEEPGQGSSKGMTRKKVRNLSELL